MVHIKDLYVLSTFFNETFLIIVTFFYIHLFWVCLGFFLGGHKCLSVCHIVIFRDFMSIILDLETIFRF